jgi:hypothetical protein
MESASLKRPSAWVPVAMSAVALAVVFAHIALYGVAREADEGATAHIFQLLIAGQMPFVAYFAWRWLPKDPKHGWRVLALQVVSVVAALAPVWYFKL